MERNEGGLYHFPTFDFFGSDQYSFAAIAAIEFFLCEKLQSGFNAYSLLTCSAKVNKLCV